MVAGHHCIRAGNFGGTVAAVLGTACALGVLSGAVGTGSASGSFPGRNGLIAFVSNRGGGEAIYTMHTTGSGVREVTPRGLQAENPSWSADGRKIAFDDSGSPETTGGGGSGKNTGTWKSAPAGIWIVDANGAGLHSIGYPRGSKTPGASPSWSPDGSKIAFDCDDDVTGSVCVMHSDGTGVTIIQPGSGDQDSAANEAIDWPRWSPNGLKIADSDGATPDGEGGTMQIAVSNSNGSGEVTVTGNGFAYSDQDRVPDWSPNGKQIAFQRGAPTGEVDVMNANGSFLHRVVTNARTPVWSPNGKELLFVRSVGGRSQIFVVNADGTHVRQLTTGPSSNYSPSWQPA